MNSAVRKGVVGFDNAFGGGALLGITSWAVWSGFWQMLCLATWSISDQADVNQ